MRSCYVFIYLGFPVLSCKIISRENCSFRNLDCSVEVAEPCPPSQPAVPGQQAALVGALARPSQLTDGRPAEHGNQTQVGEVLNHPLKMLNMIFFHTFYKIR